LRGPSAASAMTDEVCHEFIRRFGFVALLGEYKLRIEFQLDRYE
jgi:hypothetical protein